jgi:hypothetical protein
VLRRLMSSRAGKLGVAGVIVLALSAPALAEHFDFDSLVEGQPVTAEQVHVECGALEEAECNAIVQEAFEELENYDHPENHGKFVSYLTHCLKGMKGKGEVVSQMANETGDAQAELAVELCAVWKLEQASAEGDEVGTLSGKSKGKKNADELSGEVEGENDTEVSTANGGNGKGNGKGKGRQGPK